MVELSRNEECESIVIVGEKDFAIKRMFDTLCSINQWTLMTENIVDNLSISVNGNRDRTPHFIDMASATPLRVRDIRIPNTNSGFVYMLMSTKNTSQIYIGQTDNMAVRLNAHNTGKGSEGTSFIHYLPWCLAGYMTGMTHMSRKERMSLEGQWKRKNQESAAAYQGSVEQFLENGKQVMRSYNEDVEKTNPEYCINFAVCVQRQWTPEIMENEGGEDGNDNDIEVEEEGEV